MTEYYEIRIKGHIDQRRLYCGEDMIAISLPNGDTVLSGPIVDQAAFNGILSRILDLGWSLLSVKRKEREEIEAEETNTTSRSVTDTDST